MLAALSVAVLLALLAHGSPAADPALACPFKPEPFMLEAIEAAQDAKQRGEAPFGALIVDIADPCNPQIVSAGANNASFNPLWHAEMMAINNLAVEYPTVPLTRIAPGMVLVTTAEPCPMCMGAIEWTGLQTVYFGASIPYLIAQGWGQINITAAEIAARSLFTTHPRVQVIGGILADQCNVLYTKTT